MKNIENTFEDAVFQRMGRGVRRKHHVADVEVDVFEQDMSNALLKFDTLKDKDPGAAIRSVARGYEVTFTKAHVAFDVMGLLALDNPDIDLQFTPDMIEFDPDEDLVKPSKVPLWVIKRATGPNRVTIQRVW